MKKASMKYLIYREFMMIFNFLISNIIIVLAFDIMCILVPLSFKYGNLALIDDNIINEVRGDAYRMMLLIPCVMSCIPLMTFSDSMMREETSKWKIFRRSTPVRPWELAAAKYITISIMLVFSAVLCFSYTAVFTSITDTDFSIDTIATISIFFFLSLAFSIAMQVTILAFRSTDKGAMVFMGFFGSIGILYFVISKITKIELPEINEELFQNICNTLLPFAPFILIFILAAGFIITALLYKRSEK